MLGWSATSREYAAGELLRPRPLGSYVKGKYGSLGSHSNAFEMDCEHSNGTTHLGIAVAP